MVTTLTYILGILLGALVTSTVLYILKLRNTVKSQDELINEQHELIKTLTMTAFGDKIKARIKQIEEEEKNMPHIQVTPATMQRLRLLQQNNRSQSHPQCVMR